jgi:uncharacterized protein
VSDPVAVAATSAEILFILAGLVLLWRFELRPGVRRDRLAAPLRPWDSPVHEFLLFIFIVLFGAMIASFLGGDFSRRLQLVGNEVTVFNGAMAQLGMLGGIAAFRYGVSREMPSDTPARVGVFASGVATFLISLPLLTATSVIWQSLLELLGLPAEQQDLIGMFANVESPTLLVIMIILAIGTAPVTEELVFRAGLFRYFRTRMPRWLALTAPALLFAVLHVNWQTLEGLASVGPLVMLAIVFSLAYERTGRIGTSMVAHGLFNLNTIMLIFSGVGI